MSEEMFIKPSAPKAKPKRKLTEKQLAGLAKGRAKMAEKRALKKKEAETKKRLTNAKVEKENAKAVKSQRRNKKKVVEESEEKLSYMKQREIGDNSASKFNKLRMEAMDKINSEKDLKIYNTIMSGVSSEMARNPDLLYNYLNTHADKLNKTKQPKQAKNKQKKSNLELIVEEKEDVNV